MNGNDFGLTQYWSTLRPKTRIKRKFFPQTKANLESKDVETSKLGMPIEDNSRHIVETLPLKFETLVISALYEHPHIVSLNAREKSKLLNRGKVKFEGE